MAKSTIFDEPYPTRPGGLDAGSQVKPPASPVAPPTPAPSPSAPAPTDPLSFAPGSEPVAAVQPAKKPKGPIGFQPGHPAYGRAHPNGGRKPGGMNGNTKEGIRRAAEVAKEMGVDPLRFMLSIIASDVIESYKIDTKTGKPAIDPKTGRKARAWQEVTMAMKIDAAKTVLPYLMPKLMATQVTGADNGPLAVANMDLTALMTDPSAQKLALMLANKASKKLLVAPAAVEEEDAGD